MINLKIAFPNKSIDEINNLIRNTYKHYMIIIIDFLKQNRFNISNIDIDSNTKKILSNDGGLILMTAHLGNRSSSEETYHQR